MIPKPAAVLYWFQRSESLIPKKRLASAALAWTLGIVGLFAFQCFRYFQTAAAHWTPLPLSSAAWAGLLVHLMRTLAVAVFVLAAYGLGRALLSLRKKSLAGLEHFLAAALGLVLWSFLGLALALLGLSGGTAVRVFSILLAAPAAAWALKILPRPHFSPLSISPVFFRLFVAAAVLYWLAAMVPEIFADVLHYVLPSAEACLREGRWTVVPGLSSMGFPAPAATLYLWPLAWGDERLAKLLNVAVGVLWVGAVGRWVGRRWGKDAGLWSALFLAANPLFGLYVWSATAEILCGFLLFLSFAVWEERTESAAGLALFLLGAAGAVKYTALLFLPFFAVDGLRRVFRREWPVSFLWRGGFCLVLPLLPWWLLNARQYGNPLFPYFTAWFGPGTESQKALWAMMLEDQRGPLGLPRRCFAFFAASLRGIWDGRVGFTGFAPLFILPWVRLLWKDPQTRAQGRRLAWALLAIFSVFCITTGRLRFFVPFLGLVAAAAGIIAAGLSARMEKWAGAVRTALAAGLLLQIFSLALILHLFFDGFAVISGGESARDFLRRPHGAAYQAPPYPAYEYLAGAARAQDKVYVLGDYRVYRAPVPVYANTLYDVPLYALWFDEGLTPAQLVDRLGREGYTRLLLNKAFFEGTVAGQYRTPQYTEPLNQALALLGKPIYQDRWTAIFQIPIPPSIN